MVGHFAELDLIWGMPFFNRTMAYKMNSSYTSQEIELSFQMIRYWTNFAKTGKKLFYHNKKKKIFILKEIQMNQIISLFIGHYMKK
jgi:carboxylesterase type B